MRQPDPCPARDKVFLFEQNPRLFLGTLRENLQLSHLLGGLSGVDMVNTARRFRFGHFIRHHPCGPDIQMGEEDQGLSGGQRQIVVLMRMVLDSSRAVLLDEPTTSLDLQTKNTVLEGLNYWSHGRTMTVVIHRLQVLSIVDRITAMNKGRVIMNGPRNEIPKELSGKQQSGENRAITS